MSGEKKSVPFEEWIEQKIEETIESKGESTAFYNNAQRRETKSPIGEEPAFSWIDYIVGELLATYRALKIENDRNRRLREQFATTIGLDAGVTDEDISQTAREMREIFVEMRRIRGERAGKRGNET